MMNEVDNDNNGDDSINSDEINDGDDGCCCNLLRGVSLPFLTIASPMCLENAAQHAKDN